MSKYKVGDKVRIREDLVIKEWYGNDIFAEGMKKGIIATIISVYEYHNGYSYKIDDDKWGYTDEMIEGLVEDIEPLIKIIDKSKNNNPLISINNIEKVIQQDKATIIFWNDGHKKTVVKHSCDSEYSIETAIAYAIAKRALGGYQGIVDIIDKFGLKDEVVEGKKKESKNEKYKQCIVTNVNKTCPSYGGFIEKYSYENYKYFKNDGKPTENRIYNIVAQGINTTYPKIITYVIQDTETKQVYVIGESGIKIID